MIFGKKPKPAVYVNGKRLGEINTTPGIGDVVDAKRRKPVEYPSTFTADGTLGAVSRAPGDYTPIDPNRDRFVTDSGRMQEPGWQTPISQTDATRLRRSGQ